MIASKKANLMILLFFIVSPSFCQYSVQTVVVKGQQVTARDGSGLLTLTEIESVFGGQWQFYDCYLERDNTTEPSDRCKIYSPVEANSGVGIVVRAFNGLSRSTIERDARNTFIDSAAGQAQIVEGIGDIAYYGKNIHRHSGGVTIRHKLWVIEENGGRFLTFEIYMPEAAAESMGDMAILDRLKALAVIALPRV